MNRASRTTAALALAATIIGVTATTASAGIKWTHTPTSTTQAGNAWDTAPRNLAAATPMVKAGNAWD